MKDIIVLGDLNLDIILSGIENTPSFGHEIVAKNCTMKPGGSAANVAMILALNGCPVSFYGEVGRDKAGEFVVEGLQSYGLSVENLVFSDAVSTGLTISLTYPEDRMYITHPGTVASFSTEHFRQNCMQNGVHFHLSSYFLMEGLRKGVGPLLRRAREAGMSTSLDPGGDPTGTWDLGGLDGCLQYLDYFMPSSDELLGIMGSRDLEEALVRFPDTVRCVVVKEGQNGAITRYGGRIERHPPVKVKVVDTTCAGDCFDAGFLYGLSRGEDVSRCVRWGNLFGAQAVSLVGLPDITIDEFLKKIGMQQ